mmetsp:Transcript_15640/g.46362  ORF Transcript_15640/g.46362 Transcript_15640/m.46362 type:complete len:406 (-) Transcript_15640:84-1301(-)
MSAAAPASPAEEAKGWVEDVRAEMLRDNVRRFGQVGLTAEQSWELTRLEALTTAATPDEAANGGYDDGLWRGHPDGQTHRSGTPIRNDHRRCGALTPSEMGELNELRRKSLELRARDVACRGSASVDCVDCLAAVSAVRYGSCDEPCTAEEVLPHAFGTMQRYGHRPAVPGLLGLPLLILQKRSRRASRCEVTDNEAVTAMCVHPATGFAPPRWQARVGPCTVARADGQPFTVDDAVVLDAYLSYLIERWPDEPPTKHQLSPAGLVGFVCRTRGWAAAKAFRRKLSDGGPLQLQRGGSSPRPDPRTPPSHTGHPSCHRDGGLLTPPPSADRCADDGDGNTAGGDPSLELSRHPDVGDCLPSLQPQCLEDAAERFDDNPAWRPATAYATAVAMGCAAGAVFWRATR